MKVDPTPAKMRRPDSARTLIWDAQDHLAAVHASTLIEAYAWTDDGRMAARYTSSGLSESFVYAGPQMVSSYTPSNALTWEAVWGPDLDDLLEFDSTATGLQVPIRDRRGSTVGVWNAAARAMIQLHTPPMSLFAAQRAFDPGAMTGSTLRQRW